jgi:outer membrane biosynthesis protein TonB
VGTRGRDGDGRSYGAHVSGLREHVAKVPRIIPEHPEVVGSLSKEVIRREIGRHINEIRFCYTQALTARPELQGRVAVRFAISPSGAVVQALIASSDLGHPLAEQCIAHVVARMNFPAPQGGLVVVTYPFVLQQTGN